MADGFLDHQPPLAFAHRGGAGCFPENSWRAFEHAVGLGYAYLETDAHATADGQVVAFHDRTLDRVTDASGTIAALPWARVARARIGGTEPIPLLADLLGSWPQARFNIDVKEAAAAGPVAGVIARARAWDRVCLTSFSGRRLALARRALGRPVCLASPPAAIGLVRSGLPAAALGARLAARGIRCAQVPAWVASRSFIGRAHAAGLQVHVWTVNDRQVMSALLERGADGIMTDDTAGLREVLTARGSWPPRRCP